MMLKKIIMHSVKVVFGCCILVVLCNMARAQVPVILDADLDSDVDDVAALAMLHKLAANNHVKLKGVIVTSDDPYAPTCADAINTYYNNVLPIGFDKKQVQLNYHSRYTKQISEEFYHPLISYKDTEDAVSVYRKLLSNSEDSSVVIVTIGHLTSLQNLLKSTGDAHSPLDGKALALKKVLKWICMGGQFPEGKEANFYRPDPQSTQRCLEEWTNPVVFCGWEVGNEIISGDKVLMNGLQADSPVYRPYQLYNNFTGRPSWDQVAVLLLTKESSTFFETIKDGVCSIQPDGSNKWIKGIKSNHSYVCIKPGINPRQIVDYINNMLIN